MAGSQIVIVASAVEKQRLGFQAISLTNFTSDTLEPAIAEGSKVEIGSALFEFASDEAIAGLAGIANSSDVYIHLTVTGASVAASGSITAPTWDDAKQGWYSGAVRVIGGLYKDNGGDYARKWMYEERQSASIKRYGNGEVAIQAGSISLCRKVVEIGDWDMDETANVNVAHGLTVSKIRGVTAYVRNDTPSGDSITPISWATSAGVAQGSVGIASSNIGLVRVAGGVFDNSSYNATSYNRGWIIIEYEP